MKSRDISQIQLWIDDDWENSSVSSLESVSQASEDDDDHNCSAFPRSKLDTAEAILDRLTQHAKTGGRKSVRLSQPGLNKTTTTRAYSRQSAPALSRSTNELSHLNSPMRKFRSNASDNILNTSRSSQSQRRMVSHTNTKLDALLNSPMRKFRSDTSDNNLSTSRSFQSRRRKVSQANAKWDVSDFSKLRRAPGHSLLAEVSLGLSPKQLSHCLANTTLLEDRTIPAGATGSVRSKESRWATSTHTPGGTGIGLFRRPRRHDDEDSLSSLRSYGSNDESDAASQRRGRNPAVVEYAEPAKDEQTKQAPEWAEEKGASDDIVEKLGETPNATDSLRRLTATADTKPANDMEKKTLESAEEKRAYEEITEEQGDSAVATNSRGKSAPRGMMDQVIRGVILAAEICERAEDVDAKLPVVIVDWNSDPTSALSQRCTTHPCGSLVSMMGPFHSRSSPRQYAETASAFTKESDALFKERRNSTLDLGMKKPKRRGSFIS
jgi:hypothetical protein